MGLLDILSQIKNDGFDPKKDKVSTNQKLGAGKYPVRLKSSQAGISSFGQTQIAITLEVVSGPFANRLEGLFISFDDALPKFVLEKNGRTLLKLAAMAGVEFTKKDLEDEYSASTALENGIGKQFLMDLSLAPNKKNPECPYRNYDFGPLEETNDLFDEANLDLPF